ncbi:MAG: hypothetical protein V1781_02560 [Bacteroidota bacterium]
MHIAVQILLLIFPSLIILGITYLMMNNFVDVMKNFFHEEGKRRKDTMKVSNHEYIIPLRLQAYERMVLFLERISPTSLVMRIHQNEFNSHILHVELIKSIRTEYEHNLSQQIYMSVGAWEIIKTAKEEVIKLINLTADKVGHNVTGMELGQSIIEITSHIKKIPTEVAIEYLKKEIAENL